MSLEKLEALEAQVRKLVGLVQALKHDKAVLEEELQVLRNRLVKQENLSQSWEEERSNIRHRIEKVLGELEFLESQNGHSVVIHDERN